MGFLPACEVCAIDGTVRGHARELGVERLVTLPPVKRAQTKRGKSVCGLEKRNALSHKRSSGFAHHWHRTDMYGAMLTFCGSLRMVQSEDNSEVGYADGL